MKQFFETIHIQDNHTIVIIAHQVVIRCIMVYFGYINKEEALIKVIENCKPYLIEVIKNLRHHLSSQIFYILDITINGLGKHIQTDTTYSIYQKRLF